MTHAPLDHSRFEGLHLLSRPDQRALVEEVGRGLRARPQPWLPAAWLYDARGADLFDQICRTPEYYPTRTEHALLAREAPAIARLAQAQELLELGSGHARKTHLLLEAMFRQNPRLRWLPLDISRVALIESAGRLLDALPQLSVRAYQGDFTRDLEALPKSEGRRLVAFLGGTLGNFDAPSAHGFLGRLGALLSPGDHLLLAADLVKEPRTLHAAYNDAEGLTAAFNLNALRRLQNELGAQLHLDAFRHDAFYDTELQRIEMHARALRDTRIQIDALGLDLEIPEGRSVRTEISRKFMRLQIESLLQEAGLEQVAGWEGETPYALVLAKRAG